MTVYFGMASLALKTKPVSCHAPAVISLSPNIELVSVFIGELLFIVCVLPETQKSYVHLHKCELLSILKL